jgi:hypothetical protein
VYVLRQNCRAAGWRWDSRNLSDALDNHSQVDLVYRDFSNALDRIDHGLLLSKLESFGFSDGLMELIRSYLSDRFMYGRWTNKTGTGVLAQEGGLQIDQIAILDFWRSIFDNSN